MKKQIAILFLSLFFLFGCGGKDKEPSAPDSPTQSSPADSGTETGSGEEGGYYFSDPKLYGMDRTYDRARVKPDPNATPGTLSERIGYIENQWEISFDKDYITPKSLWPTVTHKDTLIKWLNGLFPYPVKVKNNSDEDWSWIIEVDVPSDKVASIDAIFAQLKKEMTIWIAEHPMRPLPQFNEQETRDWWDKTKLLNLESEDFGNMNTLEGSGSWHLPYIGMTSLVNRGVNLETSIGVGVMDADIRLKFGGRRHEDMTSTIDYIDPISTSEYYIPDDFREINHGSAVVGALSGSIMGNGKGVRGVVSAKTVFTSFQGTYEDFTLFRKRIEAMIAHVYKPRVINMSFTMGKETYNGKRRKNIREEFSQEKNFQSAKKYRDVFSAHPEVLFVVSAANSGSNAKLDNGAVQYTFNSSSKSWVYNPLSNVIIVAANGPDGNLHGYSDFGQSVDITGPAGYMTLRCFDSNGSYYDFYQKGDSEKYGFSRSSPTYSTSDDSAKDTCQPSGGEAFFGTSASAPIVSGVAALLFSVNPLLTPAEVKTYLTSNPKNGNALKFAKQRWITLSGSGGVKSDELMALDKPIPILNAETSYNAVISDKKPIEGLQVSTRDISLSIIDWNSIQDEYFDLVVNNKFVGKVQNPPGGRVSFPVKLKSGSNLIELRLTDGSKSDTWLIMRLEPDGIERQFKGNNINYAWTVNAPGSRSIVA